MIDAIVNFCKNKVTRIVTFIVMALCITILFIGGVTSAEFSKFTGLVIAGLLAIGAIIAFIGGKSIEKK